MRYKNLLDEDKKRKLIDEITEKLEEGLWLIDLDPEADVTLIGPFETIADAHDSRDHLWAYGVKYGRYLWLVRKRKAEEIKAEVRTSNVDYIMLELDTLPMEVVAIQFKDPTKPNFYTAYRKRNP
jgi:hypothetical protein